MKYIVDLLPLSAKNIPTVRAQICPASDCQSYWFNIIPGYKYWLTFKMYCLPSNYVDIGGTCLVLSAHQWESWSVAHVYFGCCHTHPLPNVQ